MNLPEHLKKKREDTGELFDRSSWYGRRRRSLDYFDAGFTSACAELLPMIEKLEKALESIAAENFDSSIKALILNEKESLVEVIYNDTEAAREALAELNKWRES